MADDLFDDVDATPAPGAEPVPQLPIGIHFGIPDEIYFAQDALGSTDKKDLALDPVEWQFKRLHGEDKDTKAKIYGSALHCRTLEGAQAFAERFRAPPAKSSIEGLLDTKPDLVAWLKNEGVQFKSAAKKDELVKLALDVDPDAPVWEKIIEKYHAEVPEHRRVTQDMIDETNLAAEWMQQDEILAPFMENGTFNMGASEVTIIYEVDGIRCRARLDHLLPGRIIDLKRYSPWSNRGALEGITSHIGNLRLDLQAADYIAAFEHAITLYEDGLVFGAPPDFDGFMEKTFTRDKEMRWVWVFVKGTNAPVPRVAELPLKSMVFRTAREGVARAIEAYKTNRDLYGLDKDWKPLPGAFLLDDESFPSWFGRY